MYNQVTSKNSHPPLFSPSLKLFSLSLTFSLFQIVCFLSLSSVSPSFSVSLFAHSLLPITVSRSAVINDMTLRACKSPGSSLTPLISDTPFPLVTREKERRNEKNNKNPTSVL